MRSIKARAWARAFFSAALIAIWNTKPLTGGPHLAALRQAYRLTHLAPHGRSKNSARPTGRARVWAVDGTGYAGPVPPTAHTWNAATKPPSSPHLTSVAVVSTVLRTVHTTRWSNTN
ncbi:Hypothetical protein PFR_JS25-2_5 [Propionibacterium freudenreichii]|nr:Hypothetical protein PFR_JS25-2_5 [Propionibacterium freudenreichii]